MPRHSARPPEFSRRQISNCPAPGGSGRSLPGSSNRPHSRSAHWVVASRPAGGPRRRKGTGFELRLSVRKGELARLLRENQLRLSATFSLCSSHGRLIALREPARFPPRVFRMHERPRAYFRCAAMALVARVSASRFHAGGVALLCGTASADTAF